MHTTMWPFQGHRIPSACRELQSGGGGSFCKERRKSFWKKSLLGWLVPLAFSCCTPWNLTQTVPAASASALLPAERELQRLGWIHLSTWACMLKMWIEASKSLRHMFVSLLIDKVPFNAVNIDYSISYPSILNKLVPEVKDFPHTHREFLFIWLEYCSHFLFIGFSAELKSAALD